MNWSNILNYIVIGVFTLTLLYYMFALKYYCFPSDKKIYFRKFIFKEIKMALIKLAIVALFIITMDRNNVLSITVSVLALIVFLLSIINDNLVVRADNYLYINAFKVPASNIKHYEVTKNGEYSTIELFYTLEAKKASKVDKKKMKHLNASQKRKAASKGISAEDRKMFITQTIKVKNSEGQALLSSIK
ncbi:MAG: hypothetical protein ACRC2K_08190 [Clostridium sp.]